MKKEKKMALPRILLHKYGRNEGVGGVTIRTPPNYSCRQDPPLAPNVGGHIFEEK